MKALINAALELCLLRLGPQQMPASQALFSLLFLLCLLVGTLVVMAMRIGPSMALLESLFQLLLMLAALHLALRLARKRRRFSQTAIALLLSGLLLDLLSLPLVSWYQRTQSTLAGLLVLALFIWSMLVVGHIIRHAFNVDFNLGIAAAVGYTLVSWNLTGLLFQVAP